MVLQLVGIQGASPTVDVLVTILVLFLIGLGVARLAREMFLWATQERRVPEVVRDFIRVAAESSLAAIRDRLQELEPRAQEAEVRAAARKVYDRLPATIPIPIRGRVYPIPLKVIVSASMFESFALMVYHEIDDIHGEMLDVIKCEYNYWKKMGRLRQYMQ